MVPSQSLSSPSHASGAGGFAFWHTQPPPPAHASVPLLHGAMMPPLSLHVAPGGGHHCRLSNEQQLPGRFQHPLAPAAGASLSGASSGVPSQSLSMPSHCSACGPTPPWHKIAPPTHAVVPGVHGGWLMPHGVPTPTMLSSTMPSQSLSIPSQISGLGPTAPAHAPHVFWPFTHWLVPP
jgi:hypothetical protein